MEDQFGNIVTTDSSNVTLSVASGPGSASGTLTVAASSGIVTFGNVKLNAAGSYTLTASDGSLDLGHVEQLCRQSRHQPRRWCMAFSPAM